MIIIDCEQGSPEWHAARCGKVTASRLADVTAKTRSGWGAGRANYAAELVAERLTGQQAERFTNAAMQWGTEKEAEARTLYAFMKSVTVLTVGCVRHPTIADALASPDGLVGAEGLVEIKCPNTATHIESLLGGEIDAKYIKQMQFQMACTGRKWCDFVTYDPRMPPDMQMLITRVDRCEDDIKALELATVEFLAEVEITVSRLLAKFRAEAAE